MMFRIIWIESVREKCDLVGKPMPSEIPSRINSTLDKNKIRIFRKQLIQTIYNRFHRPKRNDINLSIRHSFRTMHPYTIRSEKTRLNIHSRYIFRTKYFRKFLKDFHTYLATTNYASFIH